MDILNKEKIKALELEIETLNSQCEILREVNSRHRALLGKWILLARQGGVDFIGRGDIQTMEK